MIRDQKITAVELAYVLDLTPTRVRQLTVEGIFSCEKGRRGREYEIKTAIAEFITYKVETEVVTPELAELQRQRARKLGADAQRAEFNLEVLKGRFLLAEAVAATTTEQSLTIKSRVCGLGARLCHQLAPVTDPDTIREMLDEEAESICSMLVSDFTAIADEADRTIAENQGENGQAE